MAIFSLNEVRTEQIKNVANDNFESWPESATYGYFGGGAGITYVATIDRIDFSNETTSAPGNNLPQPRNLLAAVSSSSYGYFAGGKDPSVSPIFVDTVDRIDFSNETASAPGNDLPQGRYALAATSNNSYGYFAGGADPALSPFILDTVDRIDFSNETASAPGNDLPQARYGLAATSSSSYGYFGGGTNPALSPPYVATIDRIDFSNETASAPGNNLPQVRTVLSATSNNSYGYFAGGINPALSPAYVDTVDRLEFSNDTVTTPGNDLPQARSQLAATSNNSYGYFGGGQAPPTVDTVDRIDFSNETASVPGNNLPQVRSTLAAVSGGASYRISGLRTYGYIAGGSSWPPYIWQDTVKRLDFSNETVTAPGDDISEARERLAAVSTSSYGYFCGGHSAPQSPDALNTVDRIDFSNETTSAPGNNLTQASFGLAAVSSSSYGYFGGGDSGNTTELNMINKVGRLDFSNETTSAPGNDLFQARRNLAATESSSYGYFGGGRALAVSPPYVATIDRIDFSNETASAPGNNLPSGRSKFAAVSSSSYGYFGGGFDGSSEIDTINRLDFSNETFSAPNNNLSLARIDMATASNNSYGYLIGGYTNPSEVYDYDRVERVDFSNETISAPGNNLPGRGKRYSAAVSN